MPLLRSPGGDVAIDAIVRQTAQTRTNDDGEVSTDRRASTSLTPTSNDGAARAIKDSDPTTLFEQSVNHGKVVEQKDDAKDRKGRPCEES